MTNENWKRITQMLADVDSEIELLSDGYRDLGGLNAAKATDLLQQARGYALMASVEGAGPYPPTAATGA